jgi:hypothetical protein
VLGSFFVSLSSQLAILSSLLSRSPSVCQVIPEYLYLLSPYSSLPSLGYSPPFTRSSLPSCLPWENINQQPKYHRVKWYNGNLCACGPFCDRVFYPRRSLAPLLEVWTRRWCLQVPTSISVIGAICANLVVRLRNVNKHFWHRCQGGNRHKILFKHHGRIIKVRWTAI